jgi:uncharacterized membrane protein SpoIIM required for sporulation
MTPVEFRRRHEAEWDGLERLVEVLRSRGPVAPDSVEAAAGFPAAYRSLCQQLALARTRHYPPALVERLNALALAGHEVLYGPVALPFGERIRVFLLHDFPALVRRHRVPLLLSLGLTVVPAVLMALAVQLQPETVYALLDPGQVSGIEGMYSGNPGAARGAEGDLEMFAYYIWNNISVGFRCFAGGLLLGSASVLALVFNGLLLGAVAVHLAQIGAGGRFFPFVVTHSAFELTAIVLCGQGGLMLAGALIAPGRLRRVDALRKASGDAVRIVYGAAGMLVVAAFLEGFWSSSAVIPAGIKYGVAAVLWSFVLLYFLRMGRVRAL